MRSCRRSRWRGSPLSILWHIIIPLSLPALVSGALLIEKVFSWPGMGLLAANAISSRDYLLITAVVLVTSIAVAIGTLAADLATALADPRIRVG